MAIKSPKGTEHVNPNLIPMIDIMFLLLLFFMLGADMGHRDLEDVRLPKSDEAKKEPPGLSDHRLTINAHHSVKVPCAAYDGNRICRDEAHWKLAYRGEDVTDSDALTRALKRSELPQGATLPERQVMIRADGAAPFGLAQRAMLACAREGIYKVSVGAATKKVQ